VNKRQWIGIALAAVTAAAPAVNAQETALTPVLFVLPGTTCLGNFPLFAAQEQGYFADEGLEVQIESLNGSASVIQTLAAGQAQFGTAGTAPVLRAWDRGEEIIYVANLKPGGSFSIIVPAEDEITGLEDLRGKVIGAATADGSEVGFLKGAFATVGMSEPDDYTIQIVGDGGPAVAGFLRGDIDAFAASIADATIISRAGLEMVNITPEDAQYLFGNGLVTTADYAAANPEIVEGIGRAYRRGADLGVADPESVVAACQVHNPLEVEDVDYARAMLEVVNGVNVPLGEDMYDYMRPEHWERIEADIIAEGDYDGSGFDLTDVYTNDFVEAYNR
jgi:NitT/TauT family transport system substrate-binding protein